MNRDSVELKFKQGLRLCRSGKLADAATLFRQVIETGSEEPLHLSYYGLVMATVYGDRREGLRYCQRAMQFDPTEPDVVRNLARLYQIGGQNTRAIKALRRGLQKNPGHPELLKQINQLSPRKAPPLTMVNRDHVLNKHLAILLARVSGRYGKNRSESGRQNDARKMKLGKQG